MVLQFDLPTMHAAESRPSMVDEGRELVHSGLFKLWNRLAWTALSQQLHEDITRAHRQASMPCRSCKIDEGSVGVRHCMWAPDGQHVLAVADFQVRLTIVNVVDQTVWAFSGPKSPDRAIAFSPDGQLLAYGEVSSMTPLILRYIPTWKRDQQVHSRYPIWCPG